MEEDSFTNFYEVLQCDKSSTTDDLKKCYQRLVLTSHPDKTHTEENGRDEKFHLIQKAWSVLRDPDSRKQYDAMLACHEYNHHLLYDSIKLSEMSYDEALKLYSFSCRCGGMYLLESDSISSKVIIGCDECSFSIEVSR